MQIKIGCLYVLNLPNYKCADNCVKEMIKMKRKLVITLIFLIAGSIGLLNASYNADEKS